MTKEIITRKASDNEYLHKDFHIALNYGIDYLHKKFGEESVTEYLKQFAGSFYSPLKKSLKEKGLIAIKEHYEKIYEIEGAEFNMEFSRDELTIILSASPAVMHIKANGHLVSELFHETITTINRTICQDTPFEFELLEYNKENGAGIQRFIRRSK